MGPPRVTGASPCTHLKEAVQCPLLEQRSSSIWVSTARRKAKRQEGRKGTAPNRGSHTDYHLQGSRGEGGGKRVSLRFSSSVPQTSERDHQSRYLPRQKCWRQQMPQAACLGQRATLAERKYPGNWALQPVALLWELVLVQGLLGTKKVLLKVTPGNLVCGRRITHPTSPIAVPCRASGVPPGPGNLCSSQHERSDGLGTGAATDCAMRLPEVCPCQSPLRSPASLFQPGCAQVFTEHGGSVTPSTSLFPTHLQSPRTHQPPGRTALPCQHPLRQSETDTSCLGTERWTLGDLLLTPPQTIWARAEPTGVTLTSSTICQSSGGSLRLEAQHSALPHADGLLGSATLSFFKRIRQSKLFIALLSTLTGLCIRHFVLLSALLLLLYYKLYT